MRVVLGLTACCLLCTPCRAETVTLHCVFDRYSDQEGLHDEANFGFDIIIDTLTSNAVFLGNLGMSDVEVYGGDQATTFLERLATGVIQTTTIGLDGLAVHSRHTVAAGISHPSQYYGRCVK